MHADCRSIPGLKLTASSIHPVRGNQDWPEGWQRCRQLGGTGSFQLSALSCQRNRFVEGMGVLFQLAGHLTGRSLWCLFLTGYFQGNNR